MMTLGIQSSSRRRVVRVRGGSSHGVWGIWRAPLMRRLGEQPLRGEWGWLRERRQCRRGKPGTGTGTLSDDHRAMNRLGGGCACPLGNATGGLNNFPRLTCLFRNHTFDLGSCKHFILGRDNAQLFWNSTSTTRGSGSLERIFQDPKTMGTLRTCSPTFQWAVMPDFFSRTENITRRGTELKTPL